MFVVALVGAVIWRLGDGGNGDGEGSSPRQSRGDDSVAVEVKPVERRDLQETRGFTGSLEAMSSFDVVARVPGRVIDLKVDLGDRVERGQLVARLEDDEYLQQLRQAEAEKEVAEANIEEAESDLLVAERELERIRVLRGREIAAESELETAEAQLSAARARLRVTRGVLAQREAAVDTARLRVSQTEVRASWDGPVEQRAVAERFVSEGANVSANDSLLTLVNVGRLRAVIFVTERDYRLIRVGQEAEVATAAFPGETFPARVARVAPVFQAGSRQARVELEVENEDELLAPGMFVRARLQLREAPDAVAVPRDSLVRRDGREGVFLVEDADEGVARFVPIEIGIREGALIEVRSPDMSGAIVTLGQNQLNSGTKVRVVTNSGDPMANADSGANR